MREKCETEIILAWLSLGDNVFPFHEAANWGNKAGRHIAKVEVVVAKLCLRSTDILSLLRLCYHGQNLEKKEIVIQEVCKLIEPSQSITYKGTV